MAHNPNEYLLSPVSTPTSDEDKVLILHGSPALSSSVSSLPSTASSDSHSAASLASPLLTSADQTSSSPTPLTLTLSLVATPACSPSTAEKTDSILDSHMTATTSTTSAVDNHGPNHQGMIWQQQQQQPQLDTPPLSRSLATHGTRDENESITDSNSNNNNNNNNNNNSNNNSSTSSNLQDEHLDDGVDFATSFYTHLYEDYTLLGLDPTQPSTIHAGDNAGTSNSVVVRQQQQHQSTPMPHPSSLQLVAPLPLPNLSVHHNTLLSPPLYPSNSSIVTTTHSLDAEPHFPGPLPPLASTTADPALIVATAIDGAVAEMMNMQDLDGTQQENDDDYEAIDRELSGTRYQEGEDEEECLPPSEVKYILYDDHVSPVNIREALVILNNYRRPTSPGQERRHGGGHAYHRKTKRPPLSNRSSSSRVPGSREHELSAGLDLLDDSDTGLEDSETGGEESEGGVGTEMGYRRHRFLPIESRLGIESDAKSGRDQSVDHFGRLGLLNHETATVHYSLEQVAPVAASATISVSGSSTSASPSSSILPSHPTKRKGASGRSQSPKMGLGGIFADCSVMGSSSSSSEEEEEDDDDESEGKANERDGLIGGGEENIGDGGGIALEQTEQGRCAHCDEDLCKCDIASVALLVSPSLSFSAPLLSSKERLSENNEENDEEREQDSLIPWSKESMARKGKGRKVEVAEVRDDFGFLALIGEHQQNDDDRWGARGNDDSHRNPRDFLNRRAAFKGQHEQQQQTSLSPMNTNGIDIDNNETNIHHHHHHHRQHRHTKDVPAGLDHHSASTPSWSSLNRSTLTRQESEPLQLLSHPTSPSTKPTSEKRSSISQKSKPLLCSRTPGPEDIWLNLAGQMLTPVNIHDLFFSRFYSRLVHLNLWDTNLGKWGAQAVGGLLADSTCSIQSLNLGNNHLGFEGVAQLSGLYRNRSVVDLDMSENHLGPKSIHTLQQMLVRMDKHKASAIRRLNLSNNEINDVGCISIAKLLLGTELSHLDLSFNKISDWGASTLHKTFFEALSPLPLLELNLEANPISFSGGQDLCQLVALEQSRVVNLDLRSIKVTDVGVPLVAEALAAHDCVLRSLNLFDCQLTDTGILKLAVKLSVNKSLRYLSLGANFVGELGMFALGQGLMLNNDLEELDLTQNEVPFSREGLSEFRRGLKRNTSLISLRLDHQEPLHSGGSGSTMSGGRGHGIGGPLDGFASGRSPFDALYAAGMVLDEGGQQMDEVVDLNVWVPPNRNHTYSPGLTGNGRFSPQRLWRESMTGGSTMGGVGSSTSGGERGSVGSTSSAPPPPPLAFTSSAPATEASSAILLNDHSPFVNVRNNVPENLVLSSNQVDTTLGQISELSESYINSSNTNVESPASLNTTMNVYSSNHNNTFPNVPQQHYNNSAANMAYGAPPPTAENQEVIGKITRHIQILVRRNWRRTVQKQRLCFKILVVGRILMFAREQVVAPVPAVVVVSPGKPDTTPDANASKVWVQPTGPIARLPWEIKEMILEFLDPSVLMTAMEMKKILEYAQQWGLTVRKPWERWGEIRERILEQTGCYYCSAPYVSTGSSTSSMRLA